VVDRLVSQGAAPGEAPPSIVDFLIGAGGISEFRGELAAIGADQVSQRFRGRLVRDNGMPLDRAREAAAEAGLLDARFGSSERALEQSTVADLLDLIDEDLRVRANPGAAADSAIDGERAAAERMVDEIVRLAGPAIDDELIERAARLANSEGLSAFDALDQVLSPIYENAPERPAGERTGDPLPGWSDEELDAASAGRPMSIEADGMDDPRMVIDDDLLSDADLIDLPEGFQIDLGDGQLISVAEFQDVLRRSDQMRIVTEACRI
jgi:hypothetical protein